MGFDSARVEMILQHSHAPTPEWVPVCGFDSSTNNQEAWNTDLCLTENLLENITRCICPISGTYVVLLARQNHNTSAVQTTTRPMFVILCCGCCFIQSCTAFAVLLPVLYHRKCSVTFLKMQFCTTTSTVMALFTLGLVKLLPKDWSGVISSTLASLLLMGSTTLIAIILIVQYEVGQQLRRVQSVNFSSGLRGAIGLSWLLPILYAMCVPLVHSIVKMWPNNWWQEVGSFGFMLFVGTEILFVILFALLFCTLIRKLMYLSRKSDKHNSSIIRRIGLLGRTGYLYIVKLLTVISFLVYINFNEFINSCIFGLCCFVLGSSILLCFVVKAEEKLKFEPVQKMKNGSLDENFYTGSINSPLSYFTNQDMEQDNEGVPPTGKVPMAILSSQSQRCPMERLAPMSQQSVETFISAGSFSPLPSLEREQTLNFDPAPPAKSLREKCDGKFSAVAGELQNHPSPVCGNYQVSSGKCYIQEPTEFVGVGGLDILQGVASDTIVGIRARISSESLGHQHHHTHHYHQHHRTALSTPDTMIIPSSPQPPLPIITVTSHEEDAAATGADVIDGMLDRISHDLDYLLNRTTTPPENTQIVGRRKQSEQSSTSTSHFTSSSTQPSPIPVATIPISHTQTPSPANTYPISHSVQEVIIETAEE
ncbi:hypothetical protein DMENIID0001_098130 [Sergentomyia squamirostris]